jgi:hypothetical protein
MARRRVTKRFPKEIASKLMAVVATIDELDELVTQYERNGGREEMSGNASWLPFLESIDLMKEHGGYLLGYADSLSADIATSEREFDRNRGE